MKIQFLLLCVLAGLNMVANAREFKSADGSQTITGDFLRYDANNDKVTIRVGVGNNLVAPASKFSEEDVRFFSEQQKAKDQINAIKLETREKSGDKNSQKKGNILYNYKETKISFTVENVSNYEFNDLKLEYWTAVERENKGNKSAELIAGSKQIDSIGANSELVIEGPTVNLLQGAVSQCKTGCPKVAASASKVGRERIFGTKVQITNKAGEILFLLEGPNRVKTLLAEKK